MALAALAAVASVAVLHAGRGTTFRADEWDLILYRHGLDAATFLEPHVDHLFAVQIAITKVLLKVFGLTLTPFRVLLLVTHLAIVALLFEFARRRVGPWLAVGLATVFLFLGSGSENLLFPVQIGWNLAYAAGLGALLALDGSSRRSRVLACLLLAFSTLAGTGGLVFVGGAALWLLLDRSRRRELWIPVPAVLLYAIWLVGWKLGAAGSGITENNLLEAPHFVVEAAAAGAGGLLGLDENWGRPLALAGLGAAVLSYRWSPRLLAVIALAPLSWFLTALARASISGASAWPRYIYFSALLLLLAAAELLGRGRVPGLLPRLAAPVVAFAVAANLAQLVSAGTSFRSVSADIVARVAATQVARDVVAPDFAPGPVATFGHFRAGSYFALTDDLGDSLTEGAATIRRLPLGGKQNADTALLRTERVRPVPAPRAHAGDRAPSVEAGGTPVAVRGGCAAPAARAFSVVVPSAGLLLRAANAEMTLRAKRFADQFPRTRLSVVSPRGTVLFRPPADSAPERWLIEVKSAGQARVCSAAT